MSRAVDVLAVMLRLASASCDPDGGEQFADVEAYVARAAVAEIFAAAHASLAARDLADQMVADDRLRAALAACKPGTPHEPV